LFFNLPCLSVHPAATIQLLPAATVPPPDTGNIVALTGFVIAIVMAFVIVTARQVAVQAFMSCYQLMLISHCCFSNAQQLHVGVSS
jgi:hypothetical protein